FDIRNLMIPAKTGGQIPLSLVASVEEVEGVNQIQREDTKRRIIIGFNIKDRDVQTIVEELQQKAGRELHLNKGYTIQYGGSFENMTAAKSRLSIVVPIALLLIFLLLYFAFGSVKQGLLIYTAIPLSAIGGILALWARDLPFSISAGVGFIALFGVAVLNGILLVTEFNRLKKEGWTDVKRIVIHATKSKLRAVLMTALVPSLGFIPMAISTGAGGAVQKPLATVVIGGLIVSTLLTLFVLPMLYLLFEKGFGYFKPQKRIATVMLFLLFAGLQSAIAQQKIHLPAAIDSALKNNNALRVSMIQTDYYRELKKSSFDVQKANAGFEFGQFNSLKNDNRFSISQSIDFPGVYIHQSAIHKTNIQLSETNLLQHQLELKTRVKSGYYSLLVMENKRKLLLQADSIYSAFLEKAEQRFNSGDVDALELATARNQRLQISNQLEALQTDYEVLLNRFNVLLNAQHQMWPENDNVLYKLSVLPDADQTADNPLLKLQQQQLQLSKQQYKLEKSKLLPSLNLGYSNTSIVGWQTLSSGSEIYFDKGKRFSSVNAGLGIPVFFGAQRSKIKASNVLIRQKEQELATSRQDLSTALADALKVYARNSKLISSYQDKILPNASKIITITTDKLNAGEIGYLDWVILINQSIQIRSEYFNTVQQLNEAAFEIEKISAVN
ncbi:acriflavine resistance protein B, partial [Pedobacter lusitanus]